MGRTALAMTYFLAGIAGGMASVMLHPTLVSVGASGAVFGIIGALFGLLLHARDAVPPNRLKQLRSAIIAMVLVNVLFGLSVPGIDNAAHAGGAIAGLLCGLIVLPAWTAGRWFRIGLLAVVGPALLLVWGHFMPPPPPDFFVLRNELPRREREIMSARRNLETKLVRGDLAEREFADQFEVQVVVAWRALTADVAAGMKGHVEESRLEKKLQYMRLWQKSHQDLLAAVRTDDKNLSDQAEEEAEAAGKFAQELAREEEH